MIRNWELLESRVKIRILEKGILKNSKVKQKNSNHKKKKSLNVFNNTIYLIKSINWPKNMISQCFQKIFQCFQYKRKMWQQIEPITEFACCPGPTPSRTLHPNTPANKHTQNKFLSLILKKKNSLHWHFGTCLAMLIFFN